MKEYSIIILLASLLIGFTSCGDEDVCCVTPPEEVTMIGDWRLDKLCFSNGASSCNEGDLWEPDYSECVTFTEDTYTIDRDGVICMGTYTTTMWGIEMIADNESDCSFERRELSINDLTADKMTMSPLCTEGCPYVYVRK